MQLEYTRLNSQNKGLKDQIKGLSLNNDSMNNERLEKEAFDLRSKLNRIENSKQVYELVTEKGLIFFNEINSSITIYIRQAQAASRSVSSRREERREPYSHHAPTPSTSVRGPSGPPDDRRRATSEVRGGGRAYWLCAATSCTHRNWTLPGTQCGRPGCPSRRRRGE